VRQALFSMLASTDVFQESSTALDLFAGSGVVGLESLSRGVGRVTFVDSSPACAKTIEENCKELGFEARSHVVKAQAEPFLVDPAKFREEKPFTLVTLEPPYIEV
ncbi:unnamed protein product, partial [Polarella glacialis]